MLTTVVAVRRKIHFLAAVLDARATTVDVWTGGESSATRGTIELAPVKPHETSGNRRGKRLRALLAKTRNIHHTYNVIILSYHLAASGFRFTR